MPIETYLIKVAETATALQVQGILKAVLGSGGRIEMVAGRTIIASLDSSSAEIVRKTQGVALAGGINFRGRKVPKIVKKVSDEKQAGS
ncbi:hypothetical protein [Methanosarcina mazei]|jgi:hypothetical protein|uniref:RNA-binding protein n=1 Tax=Methanosarcina mazei TaxID=2209 RepID=A0A0F8P2K3_METMZ|nr:hypothetical protein [Methanosarcina mazei]KKG02343.1 hypothetical protein DU40_14860 [Methanosarcina mazei]KKG05904.1 hypothetical protein DU31_18455 [Methanosarcina mazei]KKG51300.1 hypothetical protein DU33_03945 [Methanosarcina mazei]KKG61388.1 hypothetical protein DU45_14860 [Methanosarcina mazei]KKG63970.1 hypothetical protein DU64_18730 [Methanosarcina mazei]